MRFIKKFIITLFVILLLGAGAAGGRLLWQGYQIYQEVIDGEPLSDKVEEIRSKSKYTPLSQLPDTYKNAVVAVEDKRFYKHGGIDLISTGRAVFINLKEKKLAEGGSSITQQLAKNMYFSQEKTFLRKVAELFVAFELEKNYTKDEILELDYILKNRWRDEGLIGNDVIFDYSKGYPMPQGVVGFDKEKYDRLQDRDQRRKEQLEQECEEIETFIENIDESLTRRIFRMCFVDGRRQKDVAKAVHLDRSRISRKIDSYLENAHKAQNAHV